MKKVLISAVAIIIATLSLDAQPLKLSVIGDSISTFEDMVVKGNKVYKKYVKGDCLGDWTNTYWGRLVTHYHPNTLVLERNISITGSCVAQDSRTGTKFRRSFATRYGKGENHIGTPDLVIIYGGTNDKIRKVPEVAEAPSKKEFKKFFRCPVEELDTLAFAQSYVKLVRMIHEDHPSAKILCIIGDYVSNAQVLEMKTIANRYKFVDYIDFSNDEKPNPAISKAAGCHPDIAGMDYMASEISKKLLKLKWIKE